MCFRYLVIGRGHRLYVWPPTPSVIVNAFTATFVDSFRIQHVAGALWVIRFARKKHVSTQCALILLFSNKCRDECKRKRKLSLCSEITMATTAVFLVSRVDWTSSVPAISHDILMDEINRPG